MPIELVIAAFGGFLCGFLNTVASSGSAVTLPLLVFMGLSPIVANATNRVPVVVAAFIATISFLRAKVIDWKIAIKILIPTVLGSIVGAEFVDTLPQENIKLLISVAVLLAFLLLFSGLKKILQKEFEEVARVRLIENIILFLVGFWLGLIVLDGATYLLLALIVFVRLPLVKANAYKNLVLFVTSAIALSVFARNGEVNWEIGGVMAVGAVLGGLIGARFALNPIAKVWTFRFLVIIISLELVHIGMQYIY
ncbi:MAG: hypothetical protein RLZZ101_1078 [Pseudomonadota bacterium]|jgi:uncharacterized membrane protein YfcA|nr:sulfite exporter TauE/SafE family protein [Burkholderiaceae bacterium]NBP96597.1 sulfite exporter TauE/SafE family protein [Burkholderiaceae bacterium]